MSTQCFYCENGETRKNLMIEVCTLKTSTVYLNKDQKHPGRVVLMFYRHAEEVCDLTAEENSSFFAELSLVAGAVKNLYHPDKINYAIYGDLVPHLHVHIVPKYKDKLQWGGPFVDSPDLKVTLSDDDYQKMVTQLKQEILK